MKWLTRIAATIGALAGGTLVGATVALAAIALVPQGGTGIGTAAAHAILVGNGTSAFQTVAPGTAGYVLTSNGASADPSFQAASGGAPGGANTNVQFNDSGVFGGESTFAWDKVNKALKFLASTSIQFFDDATFETHGDGKGFFFNTSNGNPGGGGNFEVTLGTGGSGSDGGSFVVQGGQGGGTNGFGGSVDIAAGRGTGNLQGGDASLSAGNADSGGTGNGGNAQISGGAAGGSGGNAGDVSLVANDGQINGQGGDIVFHTGLGQGSGRSGQFQFEPLGGSLGAVQGILNFDNLTASSKTFTFPNQSGTLCLTTTCAGSSFPFTPTTNFGAAANATNTAIWFQAGLQSSSTISSNGALKLYGTAAGNYDGLQYSDANASLMFPITGLNHSLSTFNSDSGNITIQNNQNPVATPAGNLSLLAGIGTQTNGAGGNLSLYAGTNRGSGAVGKVYIRGGGITTSGPYYPVGITTDLLTGTSSIVAPNLSGSWVLGSYATGFTGGSIPFGSSGLLGTSSTLTFDGTRFNTTYASTSVLSATSLCLTGDLPCRSTWPASFSTTSALYFSAAGLAFSTTSSNYWLTQNIGNAFSTTSAAYFLSQNQGNAFSTTSANFWSAAGLGFSTTSSNYWKSVNNFFSTTSAIYFVDASTTIPKTYSTNTFTGLNTFNGGLTAANNVTLSGITGSTQCLHVSATGVITGTGSDCGSAGGTVTVVTATYPIISSGGTTPNISTAFSTTTFNAFNTQNTFTSLFAALASSTNATTTNLAITGAAANCNGTNALTTNSTGVVGCTAQPQGTVTSVSGTANQISSTGGATPVLALTSHVIFPAGGYESALGSTTNATSSTFAITSIGSKILKTLASGAIVGAVANTDYQVPVVFTTTGSGAATFDGTNLNIPTPSFVDTVGNWFTPAVGYNSTSTAIGFLNGLFSNSSTTINGAFRLPGLANGQLNVNGGLVYSGATTTFSGGLTYANGNVTNSGVTGLTAGNGISLSGSIGNVTVTNSIGYPFVGNSTSTTLTFGLGLVSTGSTTINGPLTLSTTTAGCLNISATGNVYSATCSSGGSGAFPFTPTTNFGATANATNTPIWFQNSIQSSSTIQSWGNGNGVAMSVVYNGSVSNGTAFGVTDNATGNNFRILDSSGNYVVQTISNSPLVLNTNNNASTKGLLINGANSDVTVQTPSTFNVATGLSTLGGGFLSTASSTINGNATTTGTLYAAIASSSQTFGAGLTTCNGSNYLQWASGNFSCGTPSGGGGSVGNWFTPTTNYGALANSTSTPIWFQSAIQASTTLDVTGATKLNSSLTLQSPTTGSGETVQYADSYGGLVLSNSGFPHLLTTFNNDSSGIYIQANQSPISTPAADVGIRAGRASQVNGKGGDLYLYAGTKRGVGAPGTLFIKGGGDTVTGIGFPAGILTDSLTATTSIAAPNLSGSWALGSYTSGFLNGQIPFGSSGLLATSSSLSFDGTRFNTLYASTTALSVFNQLKVGGTASTTIDSTGNVILNSSAFIKEGANIIFGGNGFNTLFRPDSSGGEIQFQSFAGASNGIITDTGLFKIPAASTTLLSVTSKAYFGGTATTTIDATGNIVLPSGASITDTGTANGCATWATGVLGTTGTACGSGGAASAAASSSAQFVIYPDNAQSTSPATYFLYNASSTVVTSSANFQTIMAQAVAALGGAAGTGPGGKIYISPGYYYTSASTTINGNLNASTNNGPAIQVIGSGQDSTKIIVNNSSTFLVFDKAAMPTVSDMSIYVYNGSHGLVSLSSTASTRAMWQFDFHNILFAATTTSTQPPLMLGNALRGTMANLEFFRTGGCGYFYAQGAFNPGDFTLSRSFCELSPTAGLVAFTFASTTNNGFMNQVHFDLVEAIGTAASQTYLKSTGMSFSQFDNINAEQFDVLVDGLYNTINNKFYFHYATQRNGIASLRGCRFWQGSSGNLCSSTGGNFNGSASIAWIDDMNTFTDNPNVFEGYIGQDSGTASASTTANGITVIRDIKGYGTMDTNLEPDGHSGVFGFWGTLVGKGVNSAVNFASAIYLTIVTGTAPVISHAGDIAYDSTDKQFLVGTTTQNTPGVLRLKQKIWSGTIASTSVGFVSGGHIPLPPDTDGMTITEVDCFVDGGTSKAVNLDTLAGGTNVFSTTCGTTNTQTSGGTTYTAGTPITLEFGATSGTVNYVSISVWGFITRE